MFNGDFKEGVIKTATEEKADPAPFDLFLRWLYRDELPGYHQLSAKSGQADEVLVRLYMLMVKFMLPKDLLSTIVERVRNHGKTAFSFGDFKNKSLKVDDVCPTTVGSTIQDLSNDDPMRKAVLERACESVLGGTTTIAKGVLKAYTADMDCALLQQFIDTYHDMASKKLEEVLLKEANASNILNENNKRPCTDGAAGKATTASLGQTPAGFMFGQPVPAGTNPFAGMFGT
jgi:hypothetical protein